MIYTEKIRKELGNILKAFEKYINSQNYFDILYSKKAGYLWIVIDPPGGAGAKQLNTPEDMLDVFFVDSFITGSLPLHPGTGRFYCLCQQELP